MNFLDNFNTHQVEGDQRVAHISYIDFETPEVPNWLAEASVEMPQLSIQPKILQVELANKMISAELSEQYMNDLKQIGVNAIEQTKSAMQHEQSINLQKEALTQCVNTSQLKNKWEINQSKGGVKGIRRWFWDLLNYHPDVWIESDNFLHTLFSLSNEIMYSSRMGRSDWIVIHPNAFNRFEGLIDFEFQRNDKIELNNIVSHVGCWNSFKIFTCHLVDETQVLMGRSPKSDHDALISIVKGTDEWLETKIEQPQQFQPHYKLGLRTPMKVFSIPGAERSYIKWNFQYEKPSLRKYLKEKLLQTLKQKQ